jgi:hypothetical protein
MLKPLLQSHRVFIPMESLLIISPCSGTKMGLIVSDENHQFSPSQMQSRDENGTPGLYLERQDVVMESQAHRM